MMNARASLAFVQVLELVDIQQDVASNDLNTRQTSRF